MVQLRILSGKQAGATLCPAVLPCCIGRHPSLAISLEEPGVWDRHAELSLEPSRGFLLRRLASAHVAVNGEMIEQAALKNGDVIELGAAHLQFWLAQTRHRSLRLREVLTWSGMAALCGLQILLIYRLLP